LVASQKLKFQWIFGAQIIVSVVYEEKMQRIIYEIKGHGRYMSIEFHSLHNSFSFIRSLYRLLMMRGCKELLLLSNVRG